MAGKSDGMEEEGGWEYYNDDQVLPDFWQGFVDSETDFSKPLDFWLRYFTNPYEKAYGWNMYTEFWRVWVPLLLAPRHNTTSIDKLGTVEERRVQDILLNPLEQFIAGTEQSLPVFAELTAADCPPAVCGYVFKNGDTCYNCRDCGQDATCVLCVRCFTNSEHKNHRYRMHTSEGGGICDCGDAEAFSRHHMCSIHEEQGRQSRSAEQVLDSFPQDVKRRAEDLLYSICTYCISIVSDFKNQTDLRSAAKEQELFPDLKYPLKHSNYCTVLLNDENHSYNDVIRVLKKVLPGASEKTVIDLTTYVDKFGKAVIKVGNFKDCLETSERIGSLTRIPHSTMLKSLVLPAIQVAHERFSVLLLDWIPTLFNKSSGFRALISKVVLGREEERRVKIVRSGEETFHPICEAVLLSELNTWKQMRHLWIQLLMDGLMKEYESKKQLAVLFTQNYPALVRNFIEDDQERDASVLSLSVQMFTVPSLSLYLIEHCDAVSNLLQGFCEQLSDCADEDDVLDLSSWLEEEKSEFSRMLSSLNDLAYLLSVTPSTDVWTPGLRSSFYRGVEKVVNALSIMQGMDGMKRQLGMHVELEDMQWKRAYELQSSFNEIVKLVIKWIISDKQVLTQCIQLVLSKIKDHTESLPVISKHLAFLGAPQMYEVLEFDLHAQKVSLHVPLHRFLVNIVSGYPKFGMHPSLLLKRIEVITPILNLVDPVLQVIVLIAQINIGMWKRNGSQAENQAYIYNNRTFFPGLREADLLMLQLGAALATSIEQFLVNMLARYKLTKWVTGDLDTETTNRTEEFVEQCNNLVDQWFSFLIAMVGERYAPGVGENQNERLDLRRDILHILCSEPLTHSAIVKKITNIKDNECDLDDILSEISELKLCTKNTGKKVYYLRSGLEQEFNMFFYGYCREQQTAAQEFQLANRLKKGDPCPPPQLPRLSGLFSGLNRVLESSVVLQALTVTLRRFLDSSRSKYVLESHLHKTLYLIGLGLRQDESDPTSQFKLKLVSQDLIDLVRRVLSEQPDLPEHIRLLGGWVVGRVGHQDSSTHEDMDTSEGSSELLRKRRAEAVKARKAKILAQMSQQQKNFAAANESLLGRIKDDAEEEADSESSTVEKQRETVCLGPQQSEQRERTTRHRCILCQEEEAITSTTSMVLTAYVQNSTVLSQQTTYDGQGVRVAPKVDNLYLDVWRSLGPHVSSCGHVMHAKCYQKYFESLVFKERDRNIHMITRSFSNYDVSSAEYTCPICERLCNTVLPLLPPINVLRKSQTKSPVVEVSLNSFIKGLRDTALSSTVRGETDKEKMFKNISIQKTRKDLSTKYGPEMQDCFPSSGGADLSPVGEGLHDMMNLFSMSVFMKSLGLSPDEEDYRIPVQSLQAVAFTVLAQERLTAWDDKPLFGSQSTRDAELVKHLVRFISTYPSSSRRGQASLPVHRLKYIRANAIHLLQLLFDGADEGATTPCVLELDAFGLLVSLVVSLPCLFLPVGARPKVPTGQGLELYVLKLCLLLHSVQLLRGYPEKCFVEFSGSRQATAVGADLLHRVAGWLASQRSFSLDATRMNPTRMLARLEQDLLPFLRSAALFFHHLTDVEPGQELVEDGGRVYRTLAMYLGLPPTLGLLWESPAAQTFMETVLLNKPEPESSLLFPVFPLSFRRSIPPSRQGRAKQYFPVGSFTRNPQWRGGLILLPRDYTELLHLASEYVCPNSVTGESKDPALCLVCGVMVCAHTHCCGDTVEGEKVGGCTAHAIYCTGGPGIFLKVRDCYIFLLHKLYRGCTLPAPYLDQYGETDQRLKRGNPLFLEASRYEELNRMWLRSEIPEKIARMFDPDVFMLVDWQAF